MALGVEVGLEATPLPLPLYPWQGPVPM